MAIKRIGAGNLIIALAAAGGLLLRVGRHQPRVHTTSDRASAYPQAEQKIIERAAQLYREISQSSQPLSEEVVAEIGGRALQGDSLIAIEIDTAAGGRAAYTVWDTDTQQVCWYAVARTVNSTGLGSERAMVNRSRQLLGLLTGGSTSGSWRLTGEASRSRSLWSTSWTNGRRTVYLSVDGGSGALVRASLWKAEKQRYHSTLPFTHYS
ncbi:MAG TPA: hypothetical protein VGS41_13560 [Chthonomonadales bacterium]|nr:hypothetical protein [Chthonomonadales bacterium]